MRKWIRTLIVLLIFLGQTPNSTAIAATPPRTQCFITIDNAHLSTSIYERFIKAAVKVNASSQCDSVQTKLSLKVTLYKVGFLYNHKVISTVVIFNKLILPGQKINNVKTYALCLNSKRTSYYGVASATAIVGGKEKHTLDDFSDKPVALECGT